jgi:hypothetical protein
MKTDAIKHNIKHHSWAGKVSMKLCTWLGLKLLRNGRKLLKWSGGRCSWCGANCGFSSTISSKGMRCSSLERDCTDKPDV